VLQDKQQLCCLPRLLAHPFAPDSFDHAGKSQYPENHHCSLDIEPAIENQ